MRNGAHCQVSKVRFKRPVLGDNWHDRARNMIRLLYGTDAAVDLGCNFYGECFFRLPGGRLVSLKREGAT